MTAAIARSAVKGSGRPSRRTSRRAPPGPRQTRPRPAGRRTSGSPHGGRAQDPAVEHPGQRGPSETASPVTTGQAPSRGVERPTTARRPGRRAASPAGSATRRWPRTSSRYARYPDPPDARPRPRRHERPGCDGPSTGGHADQALAGADATCRSSSRRPPSSGSRTCPRRRTDVGVAHDPVHPARGTRNSSATRSDRAVRLSWPTSTLPVNAVTTSGADMDPRAPARRPAARRSGPEDHDETVRQARRVALPGRGIPTVAAVGGSPTGANGAAGRPASSDQPPRSRLSRRLDEPRAGSGVRAAPTDVPVRAA